MPTPKNRPVKNDPVMNDPVPFPQPAAPVEGLPVGAICAYAGRVEPVSHAENAVISSEAPHESEHANADNLQAPVTHIEDQGWMVCDGRALQVADYPELYAVLGRLYGGGGDTFKIPDYRGLFLRGVDTGAGVDPDASWRTAPTGSGTGAGVGSLQHDALQEHVHAYGAARESAAGGDGDGATPAGKQASGGPAEPGSVGEEHPEGLPARISRETRPVNIAVHYLIKYR